MKRLYLTRQQANILAQELTEYVEMKDSNERELFKGFVISFGDMLADGLQPNQSFEMTPISDYVEISKDKDTV